MLRPIAHIVPAFEVDLVSDVCDYATSFSYNWSLNTFLFFLFRTKDHQLLLRCSRYYICLLYFVWGTQLEPVGVFEEEMK